MTETPPDIHQELPAKTWQQEGKALLHIGVPMALTQLIGFAVFTIDVMMIGRLGPEALASASLGVVILFTVWMLVMGPIMAIAPMVSHALGANAKNYDDVRRSVRMGLWALGFAFPVIVLVFSQADHLAIAFGQDPALSHRARDYVVLLAPSMVFGLGIWGFRNFLAAIELTRFPLYLTIFTTLLNAFFNYVLIFGNFGFPRLELIGAGIGSSLAYAISFAILALYCQRQKQAAQFEIFRAFWTPDWSRFRELFRLGIPISMTSFFEGMLFNACVFLMGLIGIMEMAAYQIAINVAALAFMIPLGFSMAGGVRVGLAAGAGDMGGVRRAAVMTLLISTAVMTIFAIVVALFPQGVAMLYIDIEKPDNQIVLTLVSGFLPLAAAFMIFDAVQVAANQLLRGLKDVQYPMAVTAISYWLIGFPIAWYFGLHTAFGANGIWYGLIVGLLVAAILLGGRLWWITHSKRLPNTLKRKKI